MTDEKEPGGLPPESIADLQSIAAETVEPPPGSPGMGPAPETEKPEKPKSSWVPIIGGLMPAVCAVFFPNWGITEQEQEGLASTAGAVLDKYFPDPGGDNWREEFALGGAVLEVGAPRILQKIPPRLPEPDQDGASNGASTSASQAQENQRKNKQDASTGQAWMQADGDGFA